MKKSSKVSKTKSKLGKIYNSKLNRHPFVIPVFTFLVLFFVSVVGFVLFNSHTTPPEDSHVIEFSEAGERESIPSRAKTVGEFLDRAQIKLNHNDIVEPSTDTRITDEKFHINVYRARPVTVIEKGKANKFAYSAATTPRSVAKQAGVDVYPEDNVETSVPDSFLKEGVLGEKVVIDRSTLVNINLYGQFVPIRTHAKTVGELLKQKNIKLADKDTVKPSVDTLIKQNMQIFVVRSGTKLVTTEEQIPMPVEEVEDARLSFGVEAIRQQGSPGKKVVTYQLILKNGKEVGRKKIQEVISTEPVKQIIARGKAVYIPSDKAGAMRSAGIAPSDYPYVDFIISHESGWRTNARNGNGCIGLGQRCAGGASQLISQCPAWEVDAPCQLRHFSAYASRYGGWQGAYEAWQQQHWW